MVAPEKVTVRMYQVGFGDCFLVSFRYRESPSANGRRERHILIDFGSTHGNRDSDVKVADVAQRIAQDTDGKLDVVVVSHRHKDHLSAFGQKTARIIDGLAPDLVVRSWTEQPTAAADATGPTSLGDRSQAFVRSMADGANAAAGLSVALRGLRGENTNRGDLSRLALTQVSNKKAVDQLNAWSAAGTGRYAYFGSDTGISDLIPGITVRVLGPPTVEMHAPVRRQRADDDEYWLQRRETLEVAAELARLDAEMVAERGVALSGEEAPGKIRWLVRHMRDQHMDSLLNIVREYDDALNNTSLILLIEAGTKSMLFPGDAQIENWSYALSQEALRHQLRNVDLYKVGHHGSRNGTPRSLVGLWAEDHRKRTPVTALLSTMGGVHGDTPRTRVPRSTLVAALDKYCDLHRTDLFDRSRVSMEMEASCTDDLPFRQVRAG